MPALLAIGFAANRRLLEVKTLRQDCFLTEMVFVQVTQPQVAGGQGAPGLHLDDPQVLALFAGLFLFLTLPEGFGHAGISSRILRLRLSQVFDGCPKAPNRLIATVMGRLRLALKNPFDQAKLAPTEI